MLAFALISLFAITSAVVVISLSDSFIRGARAFKQLSRAAKLENRDYAESVQAAALRPSTVITRQLVARCNYTKVSRSLPVAA